MTDASALPIGSVIATGWRVAVCLRSPGDGYDNNGFRWSGNWAGQSHDTEIQELLDHGDAAVLRVGTGAT